MKIKLQELISKRETLTKLLSSDGLPPMVAYKLSKIIDPLDKEFAYYETARQAAVKKHGKKDEKGNLAVDQKDEKAFQAFIDELGTILQEEVEVTFDKIKFESLGENIKLTPIELHSLSFLFD